MYAIALRHQGLSSSMGKRLEWGVFTLAVTKRTGETAASFAPTLCVHLHPCPSPSEGEGFAEAQANRFDARYPTVAETLVTVMPQAMSMKTIFWLKPFMVPRLVRS